MEGMTMPFNWPKCGPGLPPARQLQQLQSDVEVSRLRRARAILSQSVEFTEGENGPCLHSLSGIIPPAAAQVDGGREVSVAVQARQGQESGPEASCCYVEDREGCALISGQAPELADAASATSLTFASNSEGLSVQDWKPATNLALESSFVVVNPENYECGTSVRFPSSSSDRFPVLSSKAGREAVDSGLRRSTRKLSPEAKSSILRRPVAAVGGANTSSAEPDRSGELQQNCSTRMEQFAEAARNVDRLEGTGEVKTEACKVSESSVRGTRVCTVNGEGELCERDERFRELRHGRFLEGRLVYRQSFVIRSYEVGVEKTASVDTLTNLFQEVALNHVWLLGLSGDGFGATLAMNNHRLICVVTRMHVEVERYPTWNELVEIDSWLAPEGKHGLRRDWLVHDPKNGQVLARATSTWVMMNKDTRKISKVPRDVRAEISPFFVDRAAIENEGPRRVDKLNETAQFTQSGLRACRRDMDANQHVNNVKYIDWIMETVPAPVLAAHELSSITMEYRQECGINEVIESLTHPETQHPSSEYTLVMNVPGGGQVNISPVGQKWSSAYSSAPLAVNGTMADSAVSANLLPLQYTHLLHTMDKGELLRGRTTWRLKQREQYLTPASSIRA